MPPLPPPPFDTPPLTPASANIVWEIRATGTDSTYDVGWTTGNGGGFAAALGGTDYSQQDSPQVTITDLTTAQGTTSSGAGVGTVDVASALSTFSSALKGNILSIDRDSSGSVWRGWRYLIIDVPDAHTLTIRAISSAETLARTGGALMVGGQARIGGCLKTLGEVLGSALYSPGNWPEQQDIVWVQGPTIEETDHVDTGNIGGYAFQSVQVIGYTSARGDGGIVTLKLMSSVGGPSTFVRFNNSCPVVLSGFEIDANSNADVGVEVGGIEAILRNGAIKNAVKWGLHYVSNYHQSTIENVEIHTNGDTAQTDPTEPDSGGMLITNYGGTFRGVVIHDNTGPGVYLDDGITMERCLIYGNDGYGIFCDYLGNQIFINHCDIDNNALGGFVNIDDNPDIMPSMSNNIWSNNGDVALQSVAMGAADMQLDGFLAFYANNAFYNNTGGDRDANFPNGAGDVTLSADPYTDAGTGDYSLNSTPGGGDDLKGAATETNLDIGAIQSAPGGGSAATVGFAASG